MKLTTIDGKDVNISKKEIIWTALYLLPRGGFDGRDFILIGGFRSKYCKVTVESFAKACLDIRPDFA